MKKSLHESLKKSMEQSLIEATNEPWTDTVKNFLRNPEQK